MEVCERKVIEITDGNKFVVADGVQYDGEVYEKIRIAGYDAPESQTRNGEVKEWLSNLILQKTVEIRKIHSLTYHRLACDVYFKGENLLDHYRRHQTKLFLEDCIH